MWRQFDVGPKRYRQPAIALNALGVGTLASGAIEIIDATHDTLGSTTITAGTNPGIMTVSPALDRVLAFNSGSNDVSILVTSSESNQASISLSIPSRTRGRAD